MQNHCRAIGLAALGMLLPAISEPISAAPLQVAAIAGATYDLRHNQPAFRLVRFGGGGFHGGGFRGGGRGFAGGGVRGGGGYAWRGNVARRGPVVRRNVVVGGVYRPYRRWRPGGAIAAGAAIGFVSAAAAAAYAGAPPGYGYCWYYTDTSRRQGYWDRCPGY